MMTEAQSSRSRRNLYCDEFCASLAHRCVVVIHAFFVFVSSEIGRVGN